MDHYLSIFLKSIFAENLALSFFLGMCTYLAVSKTVKTALGLGLAVIVVMLITIPLNNLILQHLLKKGALAGLGQADMRSWMAHERGRGVSARSLARA